MTDTTLLTPEDRKTLRKLIALFHSAARGKGFHGMSDQVHELSAQLHTRGEHDLAKYVLATHRGNRLSLMSDEITETREEIRKGKTPREVYTSVTDETKAAKPEGYLSEMADVFIRFCDTVGEEDSYTDADFVDEFLDMLETKAGFNKQRSHMNGGKKF